MTSPIETNNVVERLRRTVFGYVGTLAADGRATYAECDQQVLVNPDGPEAADLIQSLSDRIDVQLEALAKRDAAAAKCPIRRGYQDTCECCGATSSGACGMISAADYAFVEAVRASLEAGNAKP